MIDIEPLQFAWTADGLDTLALGPLHLGAGQTVFCMAQVAVAKAPYLGFWQVF